MVLVIGKRGTLEVEPTFVKDKVVFHPLPAALQEKYHDGQDVKGKFGVERPTGKYDKRYAPIYISYFIPEGDER